MVKLFLCLIKHHTMKRFRGVGVYSSTVLNLGTIWRLVVFFKLLPAYPRTENHAGTLWIRGWVSPRVGLDAVQKGIMS
jgi:hypothetical protein